jgi:erythromycin esterase-like protein
MNNQQVVGSFQMASLIIRHLKDQLTKEELRELHYWINRNEANYDLFELLKTADATRDAMQSLRTYSAGEALLRFLRKLNAP